MATEKSEQQERTCFVVMGFGKKTDFETGRTLDLDKSYRNMIKPAVEAAGLKCIRADEIVHSGLIDVPMYQQLLNADVVVADLSTSNKNAFYELGVRHALRPFTTVVIAEDGIKTFPFDVNHVAIRQYHHLGEDIGFDEVMRFRALLTQAITEILDKNPPDKDSPVYTFLNELTPPAMAAAVQAAVQQVAEAVSAQENNNALPAVGATGDQEINQAEILTHNMLMQQVDDAQKRSDWITAKSLLGVARQMKKDASEKQKNAVLLTKQHEDPYILQKLALITYKSKLPTEEKALAEARDLLVALDPDTSNDTETLGLWGAIHKRLWQLTQNKQDLDEAVRAYERGFHLRNDYYNGINFAFLLNVRAVETTDPAEAIADFVQARRVRQEVLSICKKWLQANPRPQNQEANPEALKEYLSTYYWVKATMGEAYLGLGDEAKSQQVLAETYPQATAEWMVQSTQEQISRLKSLLEKSPLRFIKADAS